MFEQSTVNAQSNPWSVAASFTFQTATVAAIIVISVWQFDHLPAITPQEPSLPLPSRPRAVEVVATQTSARVSTSSITTPKVFRAPTTIPQGIPQITDVGSPVAAPELAISGDDRGVPGLHQLGGNSQPTVVTPPPPPPPAKTPQQEQSTKPLRLGGKVLEAKLINRVMPVYPPLARNMRVSGTVQLMGVISQDGRVRNLQVLGGHPLLVKAAVDAVSQWVYSPTLLNDQPVEVIAPIEVHFTLSN